MAVVGMDSIYQKLVANFFVDLIQAVVLIEIEDMAHGKKLLLLVQMARIMKADMLMD
jgi:hypothetical protein